MRSIEYPNPIDHLVVIEFRGPSRIGFLVRPLTPGTFRILAWPRGAADPDLYVHAAIIFETAAGPPAHAVFDLSVHPARAVLTWEWALVASAEGRSPLEDLALAVSGAEVVTNGSFTLHDEVSGREVRIVAWSCHQPYASRDGKIAVLEEHASEILDWYAAQVAEFAPDVVWGAGDTGYSDGTAATDFSNQVYAKGRWYANPLNRLWLAGEYRNMYRAFWSLSPMRQVMARYPHLFMWDDHEIHDGWGSEGSDFEPGNVEMFKVARAVADEYILRAGPRVRPESDEAHLAYAMGSVAAFVFDTRSRRRYEAPRERLISRQQYADFVAFLEQVRRRSEITTLVTCTTIPFVNLRTWVTRWATRVPDAVNDSVLQGIRDDVRDSWTSPGNLETLTAVLSALRAFVNARPEVAVWNVSGDIHVANAYEIHVPGAVRPIYQLTTSAITNRSHPPWLVEQVTEVKGSEFIEGVGDVRRIWPTVTEPNVLFLRIGRTASGATLKVWDPDSSSSRDLELTP